MLVIGLGHKARQGKNVVATELFNSAKNAGKNVKMYAFADTLKTYCRDHHDELYEKYPFVGKKHKEDPIYGYVEMLQHYGTNVVRAQNPNHWCETLFKQIANENPEVAIITDVRFPNEAEAVHFANGCLVKVIRVEADGTPFVDPTRDAAHPSETALDGFDKWDFIIAAQSGDVESLQLVSRELWGMVNEENASPFIGIPDTAESGVVSA